MNRRAVACVGITPLVCIALMCSGCTPLHTGTFDVVYQNVGNEDLEGVVVEFDGFNFSKGVLATLGDARYSGHVGKFPASATVRWRFPGPPYMPTLSETIPVPAAPPPLKRGRDQEYELRFELDGKTAVAKYEINDYTWINEYSRRLEREKKRIDTGRHR